MLALAGRGDARRNRLSQGAPGQSKSILEPFDVRSTATGVSSL